VYNRFGSVFLKIAEQPGFNDGDPQKLKTVVDGVDFATINPEESILAVSGEVKIRTLLRSGQRYERAPEFLVTLFEIGEGKIREDITVIDEERIVRIE
jgi:hypothetical protein